MKIRIIDYGVGNLHSISKGLEKAGAKVEIVTDPRALLGAGGIVFPGVGAFGAAMGVLRPVLPQLRKVIASETPTLGVCLGMQILLDRSEESPGEGISAIRGDVRRIKADRIPHMGWNNVRASDDPLFEGIRTDAQFYFANSFVCHPTEKVGIAKTRYGETFVSAVRKGSIYGVQFHPEKSGLPGLRLLSNFVSITEGST
jgi:glutamine amidotransferase